MRLRIECVDRTASDPGGTGLGALRRARRITDIATQDDRFDADERAALAARLEAFVAPFEPPVAVVDGVRSLREPDVPAVVTTIEPGFLGGTLGAFVAALQTIRVARSLAEVTERPVVPLVWNDGDAHDKRRVHPAHVLNDHADLRRVGLSSVSSRSTRRHADTWLDEELHRLGASRALLETLLARAPHTPTALDTWFPRAGESWSGAVTRALFDALGSHGLVVVEPQALRVELSRATADVLSPPRGRVDLEAFDVGAAVAYRLRESGREALRRKDRELGFDLEPGSRTPAELAASIVTEPERWCPGDALLAVAQERILPVAGRVADPHAFATLACATRLADAAGTPLAPIVPRIDVAIVEPEVQRALARTGTELAAALSGPDLVGAETPPDPPLVRRLDELAQRTALELGRIRSELADEDRALDHSLRRTGRRVRDELARVRERARRVHANRSGKSRQHLRRVQQHLRPGGRSQADVLGPLPLYARFGREIGDALLGGLVALPEGRWAVFPEPDPDDGGSEGPGGAP